MPLSFQPVTLSAEQIADLKQKLSDLRHDVNNNVALMLSALEMIRRRPESTEKMLDSFARQPERINETVTQFTRNLEMILQINKPQA